MPAAVIFDLDNTLVNETGVARASLLEAARNVPHVDPDQWAEHMLKTARQLWRAGPHFELCEALGIASWEGLWGSFEDNHPSLDQLALWVPHYRQEAWRQGCQAMAIDDPDVIGDLITAYGRAQRTGHHQISGAAEVVDSLAQHCQLGLLSNGPVDIQRAKLEACGFATHFKAVCISGAMGCGKPQPDAFFEVLQRLDVEPEDAVMVGDSWERDIMGATAVGMRAVWVSNGRPWPQPSPQPSPQRGQRDAHVAVIQTVTELLTVLDEDTVPG